MPDPPHQFAAFQATEREANEIGRTHGANCKSWKGLERRAHRQQGALQALTGQQN